MDFGRVLGRAWEITWRWKVLWILGFLVSLGSGGGGGGWSSTYSSGDPQGTEFGRWAGDAFGPGFWAGIAGIILALCCVGLLIGIAVWVISIIARGGLIAGVQQVEVEGATSFGQAWRAGARRFWTLLGISILAALPFAILAFILAGTAAVGILAAVGVSDGFESVALPGIIAAIGCGAGLCCVLVALGVVLDQIRTYAERAAMLEGLGWIDAFVRGWEVLKQNLAPTIILWLIFFALGFVLAGVIFAGVLAIMLPLLGLTFAAEPGPWLIGPACCGGLVAVVVFSILGAVVETFTSATWTLAYRELTGIASQTLEAQAAEA
jgi:hypothetical protein